MLHNPAPSSGGLPVSRYPRLAAGVFLCAAWGLLLAAPTARAYVPELESIFAQIAARRPGISRAILETRSVVFDPFALYTPGPSGLPHPDAPQPESLGRAYRQKIYWIRDRLLGIETYSESGQPLHFFLKEGYRPVQGGYDPGRVFREADILPPYLPFLAGSAAAWRRALSFWGLIPQKVDLVRGSKGRLLYRLVEEGGGGVWVDRERLLAIRLETNIAGGKEPRNLRIEFTEFIVMKGNNPDRSDVFYPRTINYLMDGLLIKQTRLLSFQANPSRKSFPFKRLRNTARKFKKSSGISLARRPSSP